MHPCTSEHPAYNLTGNWWAVWQAWELTWPDPPGRHWHCVSLFCRSHSWSTSLTKTASQMCLGGTEEYDIRNSTVVWMSWPRQTRENTDLVPAKVLLRTWTERFALVQDTRLSWRTRSGLQHTVSQTDRQQDVCPPSFSHLYCRIHWGLLQVISLLLISMFVWNSKNKIMPPLYTLTKAL